MDLVINNKPYLKKQGIPIYLMNPEKLFRNLKSYLFHYRLCEMIRKNPPKSLSDNVEFIFVD